MSRLVIILWLGTPTCCWCLGKISTPHLEQVLLLAEIGLFQKDISDSHQSWVVNTQLPYGGNTADEMFSKPSFFSSLWFNFIIFIILVIIFMIKNCSNNVIRWGNQHPSQWMIWPHCYQCHRLIIFHLSHLHSDSLSSSSSYSPSSSPGLTMINDRYSSCNVIWCVNILHSGWANAFNHGVIKLPYVIL